MTCPKCGTAMNHHADKLIDPADEREQKNVDPQLGGVVQRTYACAGCGNVEFELARVSMEPNVRRARV